MKCKFSKFIALAIALAGLVGSAHGRSVYVVTHWDGIDAVAQTIKIMNGTSQVSTITTAPPGNTGTANASAVTAIDPVYPNGGYSDWGIRDYYCKPKSALKTTDKVRRADGSFVNWTDLASSVVVSGWNGNVSWGSVAAGTLLFCDASDGGYIYDVYNYRLNYSASDGGGPYNGNNYYISVSVSTSGCMVEYSSDNVNWTTSNIGKNEIGAHTVYFRIKKGGQVSVSGSRKITITTGTIAYNAYGYNDFYDGKAHGISVSPTSPYDAKVEYMIGSAWTTAAPTYTAVGTYSVKFRLSKANYSTVEDTRTVTIKPLQDMSVTAYGYDGVYDANSHAISVSVSGPVSWSVSYSDSATGPYRSWNYWYSDVGTYTVYYKVEAYGYNTVSGSETVVIHPMEMANYTWDASYTNVIYTGTQPWYDTDNWLLIYDGECTNCNWGVGYWWVVFVGRNNYTGVYTNWFHVAPRTVIIASYGADKPYDGKPLVYPYAYASGFATGQGVKSFNVFGERTDVGISPNDFTYELIEGTDLANYDVSVVTGKLTVTVVSPESLKHPVGIDIIGTNRLEVGVSQGYQYRITYSDGTTSTSGEYPYPTWSLEPGASQVQMSGGGSGRTLTALVPGAGTEQLLSVVYTNTHSTCANITNGLVAWYPCDDGYYSSSLADVSKFAKNAVKYKTADARGVPDRTETSDRAVRFLGKSSSYASASDPSAVASATNALSISAWIKPESASHLGLLYRNGQISLKFTQTGDWYFNSTKIATSDPVVIGEWQLMTFTWDGTTAKCYRNAALVGSAPLSKPLPAGNGSLYLGRSAVTTYFYGAVDDLRLFDRAIDADEISSIYWGHDVVSAISHVVVSDSMEIGVDPHCRIPVALDVETLAGDAINTVPPTKFSFTTGCDVSGGEGWFGQYSTYCGSVDPADMFDYDAVQSGKFNGSGVSWLQTTSAKGAGTLSFWWKTECEATYDYLVFKDNGVEIARLSGSSDWVQRTFTLPGTSHTLRWEYVKDGKKNVGADAAWVDRIEWTQLDVPTIKPGLSSLVDATDGAYDDYVYLRWLEPDSSWTVLEYVVKRKVAGEPDNTYITLASNLTARAYTDVGASPGVAYTYLVEARNSAGWGSCGTDDGHRGVSVSISPDSHHFSNVPTDEYVKVYVTSNAAWKVTCPDWLSATIANGSFTVVADANEKAYRRSGEVVVTCGIDEAGNNLPHAKTATLIVTQSASVDIGFEYPEVDWRTQLQITSTNSVSAYEPVTVLTTDESLRISFGWKNWSDVDVELPAVKFRVFNENGAIAISWTENATDAVSGRSLSKNEKSACGFWSADNLKMLPPGDYKLEAELDPEDLLDDPVRNNNKQLFRFAVRDGNLAFGKDVFFADTWSGLAATNGNDFAQAPHVAVRTVEVVTNDVYSAYEAAAVQFGPYVPMDGVNGRYIVKKKPVDIVLLVDFTASMDPCIAGLVNNIGNFIDCLLVGDAERGISPIDDLRIKIVGFSDYKSDCGYKTWMREYGFTTDRKLLKLQLNELKNECYGGGGNAGESSYDALYYICKGWSTTWDETNPSKPTAHVQTASPFRSMDEAARAVVMFTDEPPHLPLDAPGCQGVDINGLDAAIKAANVNLTIIGDGYYYRNFADYEANIHRLADLVELDASTRKLEETYPKTLADFTQNISDLQALAETIVEQVPSIATVVEPSFSALAHGEGTLHFRWCNDSYATGTNNTFTFRSGDATAISRKADGVWHDEEIEFTDEGFHPLKWTYRKLGYEGDWVVDCGLLTDIMWKPRAVELEITPAMTFVDCMGTNEVQKAVDVDASGNKTERFAYGATYDVKCNSSWRVIDYSKDWINIVQGEGVGDGSLLVTVSNNASHVQRTGFITVEAGEEGTAEGCTNITVRIQQNKMPYEQKSYPQILSVGVKPRWPWNDIVDIDFDLLLGSDNAPANITFTAVNGEGGEMLQYYPALTNIMYCTPKKQLAVDGGQFTDYTSGFSATFRSSGIHRISWKMGKDWYNLNSNIWKKENAFHTPSFSVIMKVLGYSEAGCTLESAPVRVDVRVNDTSASNIAEDRSGGAILTGVEMIGHPEGVIPPVECKTTLLENGWNTLEEFYIFGEGDSATNYLDNAYTKNVNCKGRYDKACVINDVYIEGGVIMTNTSWRADKVHVIRDNVFVHKDAVLTIEDGAILKFCYSTYLYIYKDKDKSGIEEFNIRVKGSYWTSAWDASIGDDTLHNPRGTNSEWAKDKDSIPIRSNSTSTSSSSLVSQVGSLSSKAVLRTDLRTMIDGKSSFWRYRYYSREQQWGNLPRLAGEGEEFFGWYDNAPDQYVTAKVDGVVTYKPSLYTNKTAIAHMISTSNMPTQSSSDTTIYALILAEGWADSVGGSLWGAIDAGSAELNLSPPQTVYDGSEHKPLIESISVYDSVVPSEFYSVSYGEGNFITAGVYKVTADFNGSSYSNSPVVDFVIAPRSVIGGAATLSSSSAPYVPNSDGGVATPTLVCVTIPADDELGLPEFTVPVSDLKDCSLNFYDLVKDETHYWPRPGIYHVEISFNDNYSGTLTNEFVIEKNPDYYFTSAKFSESSADGAAAAAKESARRILYFAGEIPLDKATEYVRSLIGDDIDYNEWVVQNFVCWVDSAGSEAFLQYCAGMDSVACPLICVLNPDDLAHPIVRTCGYQTKESLSEFLEASLTAPVAASAVEIGFAVGKGTMPYNGEIQKPSTGDIVLKYGGATLASSKYDLVFAAPESRDVGAYGVQARLKSGVNIGGYVVTGETSSVSYEIVPCEVGDGMSAAVRAKLGIELDPVSAVYNGEVQRPVVESIVPYASVDYGTDDWFNTGWHTLKVKFDGNYKGVVSEEFHIVPQAVSATVELDRTEEFVSSKTSEMLRPNILRVYDAERDYLPEIDYTVDYGPYVAPGTNTITIAFCGNYSGVAKVDFVINAIPGGEDDQPEISGDPGTKIEGDAENGFVLTPSSGMNAVTVIIPAGVAASKITVRITPTVAKVKPNGAAVRIYRGGLSYDINRNLNVSTNEFGEIDIKNATVKDEVVREVFDPAKGGKVQLGTPDPSIEIATREGLQYMFREGETIEHMKADDPLEHVGDGKPWKPALNVKGGASGFYGVEIGK